MRSRTAGTILAICTLLAACAPLPVPQPEGQGIVLGPLDDPVPADQVSEQPTFAACTREPADPASTNLQASELTDAERASVRGWAGAPIPDGHLVLEHAADLTLPAGLLGFGNGYDATTGGIRGAQLREVAPAGSTAPVTLAVLDSPSSGRLVAFLEVRVGTGTPVRWEEDVNLGFGTDGGDGGVYAPASRDASAVDDAAAFDAIDAMYPDGDSSHGNVCVVRSTRAGVDGVDFTTGYGDGGYPTFVGYDSADRVVSLVSYGFVIPWALSGLPGTRPTDPDL